MNNEIVLERKLNPLSVWALALGSIIGWGAFVMPGTTFLPKAGTMGTTIGMAVSALIMIIIAFNYSYMVQKLPVAGGEYAFTKATMGKTHSYICGWFLILSFLAIVPLNATALALVSRKLFGGILEFGYLYTVAGWDIYVGEIMLASAVLILFALLSVKGVSVAGNLQTLLALALVASVLVLGVVAIFSPHTSAANLKPSYPVDSTATASIISIIAVSPWAFVGFGSIPQSAEEFNFSTKKVAAIMVLAILFGGAVYVILNLVTASVMPWEQMLAANYDWPTGEAAEIVLGKFGLMCLGVALVCAVLSGIIGFYMATSRLLMSMAREGALPQWFAVISPEHKTPKNAIIFIMVISLTAPWFGRQVLGWIVDMSSIGAAIGYGYTCLATYKTLKANPQDKKPVLKVLSVLGMIFSVIFVGLLLIPGAPSFLVPESWVCLGVWVALGIIFFIVTNKEKKA